MDLSEQGDNYIVEAELPGVKKENIEVRVGEGGRSITIEGKIVRGTAQPAVQEATQNDSVSATQSTDSAVAPNGELLEGLASDYFEQYEQY